jgi:alpha-ketoglutarate-dependent 2,4-dichlorophenoxyacetate dioxygenase
MLPPSETGQLSLAVGRHAYGIPGLGEQESAALRDPLLAFAVNDDARVVRYSWREGDVVVWANRCLMHRAFSWDYAQPLAMLHLCIAGDPASEGANNA